MNSQVTNWKCDCSSDKGCNLLNIGHSSKLIYDCCAYTDRLDESTGPIKYKLDGNQIYNCNQCLSTLGPRSSSPRGQGVSTAESINHPIATSQELVDVESILSNRNVKHTKCRRDEVNQVNLTDVEKFRLNHMRICNDTLNPLSSRLSMPAANYRDMAVNRFYNLPQFPQEPIFYNFAINTSLEAKDNFVPMPHKQWADRGRPEPVKGFNLQKVTMGAIGV
jgi:hypothetical protein